MCLNSLTGQAPATGQQDDAVGCGPSSSGTKTGVLLAAANRVRTNTELLSVYAEVARSISSLSWDRTPPLRLPPDIETGPRALAERSERGLEPAHGPPRSANAQPACHLHAGTGSAAAVAGCGRRRHGDELHRRPRPGLLATAVGAKPVDWRPPPNQGISVLGRRPQFTAGEHKESGKPLWGNHLTGQQNTDRITPRDSFWQGAWSDSASGGADWRCRAIQR